MAESKTPITPPQFEGMFRPDMRRSSVVLTWLRAVGARLSDRGQSLIRQIPRWGIDESTLLVGFAVAIGAAVGVAVILFYRLINWTQAVSISAAGRFTGFGSLSILLVVLIGFAAARLLVKFGAGDSDGHNIPDITRAIVKRGGIIHALPVAAKTASAAIAIGAGGNVGAEGPVAVAGAALGSRIGRFFRSGPARLKVLIACGSAAGISAAFNAPIAGVFFSLEKVLGTFAVSAFPPILVASVIASVVARAAFGNSPVIEIQLQYGIGSATELLLYTALGVVTGLVAVFYTKGMYAVPQLLGRIKGTWRQLIVAGIVVGTLNIAFREDLWGHGHETLNMGLIGAREGYFLIALAFAKLIATSMTLAVTRSGGVFTPALFIGATLSGGLAVTAAGLFPGFAIQPEAFALVGMAGLVAGATHAPLMIVFEMTSDYDLILPLMLTGAVSYITAKRIYPESIYSEWLARKGEHIAHGQDTALMERLQVAECYNPDPHVIGESATVQQILKAIGNSTQTEFPVMDADRRFAGMLTYTDLRVVVSDAESFGALIVAGDLASSAFESVTKSDSLRVALQRLGVRGGHHLPVVDEQDPTKLVGLVNRQEIFTAYDRALLTESG